ncbi:hypothetical protein RRG08_031983 [Elysia crispata]|uniref:Uncharacterized protein n=1 Tax=Elysia crispata TaxID=231223 RepID=A0AAE0Z5Q2_9GAST|nr:hypothetical protein RRG08_031983 [Elysia crispata]
MFRFMIPVYPYVTCDLTVRDQGSSQPPSGRSLEGGAELGPPQTCCNLAWFHYCSACCRRSSTLGFGSARLSVRLCHSRPTGSSDHHPPFPGH